MCGKEEHGGCHESETVIESAMNVHFREGHFLKVCRG